MVSRGLMLHLILSGKEDKAVVAQDLHIVHQPVVEGLSAVAEAVLHVLGQGAHRGLAVDVLPEEAAVLVQLDVADPRGVEKLLSQAVVKAPVDHVDGDHALLVLAPGVLGVDQGDIVQIVFLLFLPCCFSFFDDNPNRCIPRVYSPACWNAMVTWTSSGP